MCSLGLFRMHGLAFINVNSSHFWQCQHNFTVNLSLDSSFFRRRSTTCCWETHEDLEVIYYRLAAAVM